LFLTSNIAPLPDVALTNDPKMGFELYGIGPNFDINTEFAYDAHKFAYYTGHYLPVTNSMSTGDTLIYEARKTKLHVPNFNKIERFRFYLKNATT
jgi:hypothetical protein